MGSSLMPIMFIAIIGLACYAWYKKRKENKKNNQFISSRKNKDEVWLTIKRFLKDNGEYGQELIDSYVIKRNHIDMVDPNGSYQYKKNKNFEIKIRKWFKKNNKYLNNRSNHLSKNFDKPKDLYIVIFITKNKNGEINSPRCFECEVVSNRISKKEYDRKIIINKPLNYDHEMEWIAPVYEAEKIKQDEMKKKIEKQKLKKVVKEKKIAMKAKKNVKEK